MTDRAARTTDTSKPKALRPLSDALTRRGFIRGPNGMFGMVTALVVE